MDKSPIQSALRFLVLGFCAFMGGYVANLGPHAAKAQFRPLPPQGNQRVQRGTTDMIIMPPEGLRFIANDGKPVMAIAAQGARSVLALFDGNGQPTVTISAGNGGFVNISTSGAGATVSALSTNRSNQAGFEANSQGTRMVLSRADRDAAVIRDDSVNGSQLSLAGRNGKPACSILFGNDQGMLSLIDAAGQPLATLGYKGTSGTIELKDNKKKTSSHLSGDAKLTLTEGEKTLFSAPPAGGDGG